ncbi:voltage gated chloride channel-domain-containing protein [Pelagophyceae sp. CCMP2097]|nr:voltage gated chloride channel-domain-containing protein [Pelagophyceae sp. CCMP2097]
MASRGLFAVLISSSVFRVLGLARPVAAGRRASRRLALRSVADDSVAAAPFKGTAALLLQAGLVGAVTGAAVSEFKEMISAVERFSSDGLLVSLAGAGGGAADTAVGAAIALAAVPALGGAVVGALRAATPSFDALPSPADAPQVVLLRALSRAAAAVATLGTGNSLGPEGPAVDIGKAVAAGFGADPDDVRTARILKGCGAAAGVAAGFSAPIAGIFFVIEVIARDDEKKDAASVVPGDRVVPRALVGATALASALSAFVAQDLLQCRLQLSPPEYIVGDFPLLQLPSYLGLGVVSGLVALALRRTIAFATEVWADGGTLGALVPKPARPAAGGLLVGLLGAACPQVLFNGYATLNAILSDAADADLSVPRLCGFVVLKVAATASSVGCGLVGGLFAPSLFLGGTAGGAYGQLIGLSAEFLHTTLNTNMFDLPGPAAYATVGAASVLAALFEAPLTGAMSTDCSVPARQVPRATDQRRRLLFELTREYDVILPLIASAGVASAVTAVVNNDAFRVFVLENLRNLRLRLR